MLPDDGRTVSENLSPVFVGPTLLQQFRRESVTEAVRVRSLHLGLDEHG
jgi:hypothetical protein